MRISKIRLWPPEGPRPQHQPTNVILTTTLLPCRCTFPQKCCEQLQTRGCGCAACPGSARKLLQTLSCVASALLPRQGHEWMKLSPYSKARESEANPWQSTASSRNQLLNFQLPTGIGCRACSYCIRATWSWPHVATTPLCKQGLHGYQNCCVMEEGGQVKVSNHTHLTVLQVCPWPACATTFEQRQCTVLLVHRHGFHTLLLFLRVLMSSEMRVEEL